MSEIEKKVWILISVASPTSEAKLSAPCHGSVVFCALFFSQLWTLDLGGSYCAHVWWQDSGSRGAACWSQWYSSASSCSPQGQGDHGCPMILGHARQQPLWIWTAEPQTGPPTDLLRMVGLLSLLPLTTCPNEGLPLGHCITVPPQRPAWPETRGVVWLKISCGSVCSGANNLFLGIW